MNQKQLKTFKRQVNKWRDYFGLLAWEITVSKDDFAEDVVATTNFDLHNRWARIRFNNEYTDDLTNKNLDGTAFHEVCELLLCDLRGMCEYGYSREMVDAEIHKVIRTLENIIL